jgi:hypothetical protein
MTDDGRARAARLLARSRFAMPRADAIAHIEERRKTLIAPAAPPPAALEANFAAPEPMPVIDQPEHFAADFWKTRRLPGPADEPPKPKPTKPRGRRPRGELKPEHDRFRIVDGDKSR